MSNYNHDLIIRQANRIAELEKALQFYANPLNWIEGETGIGMAHSDADMDMGSHARAVLDEEKV